MGPRTPLRMSVLVSVAPNAAMLMAKPAWRTIMVTAEAMPVCVGGASARTTLDICGFARAAPTPMVSIPAMVAAKAHGRAGGDGSQHEQSVSGGDDAKRNDEEAPPSPPRNKAAADQRYQQHRQRRRKQRDTCHLHADEEPGAQEQRQVDEDGPVAELDGSEQRADPGHCRCCEYAGIEHRTRTAPLLQNEQQGPLWRCRRDRRLEWPMSRLA